MLNLTKKQLRKLKINQMRNTPILPLNNLSKINNIDNDITPTNNNNNDSSNDTKLSTPTPNVK